MSGGAITVEHAFTAGLFRFAAVNCTADIEASFTELIAYDWQTGTHQLNESYGVCGVCSQESFLLDVGDAVNPHPIGVYSQFVQFLNVTSNVGTDYASGFHLDGFAPSTFRYSRFHSNSPHGTLKLSILPGFVLSCI
jgi:hypothetical protein